MSRCCLNLPLRPAFVKQPVWGKSIYGPLRRRFSFSPINVINHSPSETKRRDPVEELRYKPLTPPQDPRKVAPPNSFLKKISLIYQKYISPKQNLYYEATGTARYMYFEAARQATPEKNSLGAFEFWYQKCEIPMTFQSWFQITQLHLWILHTRIRGLPKK